MFTSTSQNHAIIGHTFNRNLWPKVIFSPDLPAVHNAFSFQSGSWWIIWNNREFHCMAGRLVNVTFCLRCWELGVGGWNVQWDDSSLTIWSGDMRLWRCSRGMQDGRPWAHWKGSAHSDNDDTSFWHSVGVNGSPNLIAPVKTYK